MSFWIPIICISVVSYLAIGATTICLLLRRNNMTIKANMGYGPFLFWTCLWPILLIIGFISLFSARIFASIEWFEEHYRKKTAESIQVEYVNPEDFHYVECEGYVTTPEKYINVSVPEESKIKIFTDIIDRFKLMDL